MKVSKVCPKCGSSDLVRFDGYCGAYGGGNIIPTSAFNYVKVNRYVCCSCGFVEEWIDKENIEKIKRSKRGKHL